MGLGKWVGFRGRGVVGGRRLVGEGGGGSGRGEGIIEGGGGERGII